MNYINSPLTFWFRWVISSFIGMKWEKDTAADIVMGAVAKLAEDMVHGTSASLQDISRYHGMYKNMTGSLERSADNLRKHMLRKKWMSREDKKALRMKIAQIRAVAKTCDRLRIWCAAYAAGTITELKKMEVNEKLAQIVSRIEEEHPEDEDQ